MGRVFEKRKYKMFARYDRMAKGFTRAGKEISIAVKLGGADPQAILNEDMPEDLCARFYNRYETTREEILDNVYRHAKPNRYLAGFSKFAYQNQKEEAILSLLVKCFEAFLDNQIVKYTQAKNCKLHLTGSVAFYYSNLIRPIAESKGILIGTITENPIAGLTLYHLGE